MNSKIKINKYITVCLEHNKILIYIQGERFQELEYSFLNRILNANKDKIKETITQGKIYWNHHKFNSKNECFHIFVNILKFWIRNNYDTGILLYNFSFPLLKKLVEVGDPQAKKAFINEILKNLWGADPLVVKYLINEKYDDYVGIYNTRRNIHTPNIKGIKLTLIICILNIFIYILFTEVFHIEEIFIFDLPKIINKFELWRIFTSIFIHSGRFSLLINTFFLISVGSYFEINNLISKHVYLIVYFISGIMGNIGYMLISSQISYYVSSAGASGAIFGLTGAFIIVLIIKEKYYWSIIYSAICGFFYFYTIDPQINYISHLFGFITGIIIYVLVYVMEN
ncbi:MAG: rhomboid family intramembrane serine protease [Promethearchaeota archaeon]